MTIINTDLDNGSLIPISSGYKLNELKTALADKYINSNNELYLTIKDI